MTRRARAGAAGFSLVELMIALVISAVVIAGALSLLTAQQQLYQRSSGERNLQDMARIALDQLSTDLRLAGYGIDPGFAFDFGPLANVSQDRLPSGQLASVAGYACANPVACRDSTAGPDEVVLHYRDPSFFHTLTAQATAGSITVNGPLVNPIQQGQLLEVVCYGGDMVWAYVTANAAVAATTTPAPVTIPLAAGNGNVFGAQNQYLTDTCFSPSTLPGGSAMAFKVDRLRYFIQSYDPTGAIVPWGTAGARPYLMLDQGLLDPSGAPLAQVIAPDVEDLQVAYLFPRSATPTAGATSGTALAAAPSGIDTGATCPVYSDPSTALSRSTHHPVNIGAVQVSIVIRTPAYDSRLNGQMDMTLPAEGNRPALLGPAGYRRQVYETTVATPNLDARASYFPAYSTSPTDLLDVGGG